MCKRLRRTVAAAVTAAALSLSLLAAQAAAHVDSPTVTALHAFVGDPLFGLGTTGGTLLGILPDEQTAMASSTKLMTLDVTIHAINDGVVSPNDQVSIDPFAASIEPNNSVMSDINGVTLEPGEIVSLDDLIRGMMYPSGNDAAWAIAYHVANAYGNDLNGDTVVDGYDFVEMMNQHALALGLSDTHFTSANGWDDPSHYTTARELAKIMEHGLQNDPYFQQVVGFVGTWTATTQGPSGPKTYMLNFPFFGPPPLFGPPPPGWEGGKGGGTTNCNGPNNGCMGASAKRIGRRVVLGFMQGQPWSEEVGMFDYGFATIFHPDPRGSSVSVGGAERDDLVCFTIDRCVSAVLPPSGDVQLVSWAPDVDSSSIGLLDQEPLPKSALPPKNGQGQGPSGDVAVARLFSGPIALASRKGASVNLSRWSIDGGGSLSLVADGIKMGPATTMDLQPVYNDMFVSVVTDPDGALVVKTWQLDGSGLVERDTYRDDSRLYSEVSVAGPLTTDVFTGHRAVTAAVAPGVLVHDVWGVDQTTGEISRLGELVQVGTRDRVEITPFYVDTTFEGELFPPAYYATAYRAGGALSIRFYRIAGSGDPVNAGLANTGLPVEEAGVAPLGIGGVLAAVRGPADNVELLAWEARRNADNSISPDQVSQHTALDAGSLDIAGVPSTHAAGDYVTAVTDPLSGNLRLRAYRSGDRRY